MTSESERVFMQNKKKCTLQYNSVAKRTSLLCSYMFHTESSSGLHTKPLKQNFLKLFALYFSEISLMLFFFLKILKL